MNKPKFDATYAAQLHRWTQLGKQATRTWREQQEFEALNRQLEAQEVRTVRELTDDYAQLMQMGDLGGVELL